MPSGKMTFGVKTSEHGTTQIVGFEAANGAVLLESITGKFAAMNAETFKRLNPEYKDKF